MRGDTTETSGDLMIGETSLRLGMLVTQLQKLALANKVPHRQLAGRYLVFREADHLKALGPATSASSGTASSA